MKFSGQICYRDKEDIRRPNLILDPDLEHGLIRDGG